MVVAAAHVNYLVWNIGSGSRIESGGDMKWTDKTLAAIYWIWLVVTYIALSVIQQ